MSTTVDSRVVEMRFDNKQFESNVQTSMSTLDKLKQKLNLNGAAKGLDGLGAAAKKVDFSGMSKGIDVVNAKFSAMQVVGMTALSNITNSAINAGKRMISALTIEPITTGFQEYETQINAIQTILANTQKEGTNVEIVNKALDELNTYADKTIYNFTEMTRNIGTFTAAGVKLQTSVDAIQGIANLAAVSGSTSQQASTAMYQLSQALASGTVKLMDWNSVVNAGMGGQVFQDALRETSELLGTGAEAAIKAQGSFRDSLHTGWLTSEVLTETLKKFTTSGANEYVAKYTGLSEEAVQAALDEAKARYGEADAIKYASKALAEKSGKNAKEIQDSLEFAKTAEDAATKVKTFSQLWDTMKEAAQSGWGQTWRLIVGDFEEAKELLTGISDFFTGDNGVITKMSNARNELLEGALGKSFTGLSEKLTKAFAPVEKVSDMVSEASKSIEDLGKVVDDVIIGKFGNGKDRFDALTKAGQNYYKVQNKVNEKLGNSKRYTQEQIDAQDKLLGKQQQTAAATSKTSSATKKLTDEQKKLIKEQYKLYQAKDKDVKFTEDQIAAYQELESTAEKLGLSVEDLVDNIDKINGRWLLIDSFKKLGQSIVTIFSSIGKAWRDVFEPMQSDQLFDGLTAFHRIAASVFESVSANADNLTATFRGLFSIIHIITSVVGGGFKLAFQVLAEVLSRFDMNILDFTAGIGNALTRLDQFITKNELIKAAIDFIADSIVKAIGVIDDFVDSLVNQPAIQEFIDMVKEMFGGIFGDVDTNGSENLSGGLYGMKDALDETSSAAENFKTIFEGLNAVLDLGNYFITASLSSGFKLLNSLLTLFGTNLAGVLSVLAEYVIKLRDWVKENTIFVGMTDKLARILQVIIQGVGQVVDAFLGLDVVQKTIQRFKDLIEDLFGVFGEGIDVSFIDKLCSNLEDAFNRISKWVESLKNSDNLGRDIVLGLANGIREGVGIVIDSISSIASTVIETFCSILGIHSPSTVAFGWGKNIIEGLVNGLKAFVGMIRDGVGLIADSIVSAFENFDIDFSVILDPIKNGLERFIDLVKGFDFTRLLALIPIGVVLIFAKKVYDVSKILSEGIEGINSVIKGFAKLENSLAGVADAYAKDIKAKAFRNIALSLAILIGAVALLTFVDQDKLFNAVVVVGILSVVLVALAKAMDKMSSASGSFEKGKINFDGIKTGLIQIGLTLVLLASAVRLIGTMNPEQAAQGFLGLAGLIAAVAVVFTAYGLLAKNAKAAKNMSKAGSMLLKMSISLLILVGVCKLISSMSWPDMGKAVLFITGFTLFVSALVKATTIGKKQQVAKISGLLLSISLSLTMMVGVIKLVSLLRADELVKGVAFVAAFTIFVAALVAITKVDKGTGIAKISGLILSMSVGLMLMVAVCKLVASLSVGDIVKGIGFVTAFGLLLSAFVLISKIGGSQVVKATATILAFSIGLGILSGVAVMLSMMPLDGLAKGVAAVAALGAVMTAMVWATRGANDVKGNLTVMAAAIAIMAGSIAVLSLIDTKKLAVATTALSVVMGMFAILAKVSGTSAKASTSLVLLTAVVAALSGMLYILSSLEVGSTLEVAASLSLLIASLAVSLKLIGKTGGSALSAMPAMLAMSGVLAIIAAILGVLASLKVGSTLEIAMSLSMLMLSLSASMLLISNAGPFASLAMPAALAMSGVLAIIAVILGSLAALKVGPTLEIAASLSMLMLSLSAACLVMAGAAAIATVASAGLIPMMTLMVGMGALMAAIAGLVTWVPDLESFLSKALPILKLIGEGIGEFLGGIIAGMAGSVMEILPMFGRSLSAFMVGLQPFIAMASTIDSSVLTGIGFLAGAILVLTAANLISGIGQFLSFGQSFSDLGTQLSDFITNAQPFLSGIKDIDPSAIESATTLAELILTLTKAELLSGIGNLISWFTGGNSFEDFGEQLTSFGSAMKKFSDSISGIDLDNDAIDTVIKAGTKLAELQSSLEPMNGVIQWFTGEKNFEEFGDQIVSFGTAMRSFSEAISGISLDDGALKAVVSAGTKLAELQSSLEPMNGVIQWFTGDKDFARFGEQIVAFGNAMKEFAETTGNLTINEESVDSVIQIGSKLAELQSSLESMGGVISWFTGDKDFETFGEQIVAFGDAIKNFIETSNGLTINEESVNSVINISAKLAELQSSLESMGGVISWFTGDKDFKTFGEQIVAFGESISSFAISIGDGVNETAVTSVVNAGTMITELQKALPKEGLFDGKMNLTEFSDYVSDFSTAMVDFSTDASGIDADGINTAINAANRIKYLIESLKDLDTSGVAAFTGIGFGAGHGGPGADGAISDIAKAISDFCAKVSGIDTTKLNTSVAAANKLKGLISSLVGLDTSGVSNFKVESIGTAMKNYSDKVAGINLGTVSGSVSAASKLKSFISSLSGLDTSGVGSFISAINQLGKVSIDGIVKSFSGASSKLLTSGGNLILSVSKGMQSKQSTLAATVNALIMSVQKTVTSKYGVFQSSGAQLMLKLATGLKSRASSVSSAIRSALASASSSIRGYYSSFYSAGSYLGSGLVIGINSKQSAAYSAGYRLGQAAVRGEKDGQASHSPSKLTIQAGKWLGEGLIIGINKMGSKVYSAGHDLGENAAASMTSSISRIAEAINTDIDAQPTIRPVLDLDEIKNGAGTINSLLGQGATVGYNANLNAISTMMNQNGVRTDAGDVVTAINKLRKDLGNVGNTSYNINGITYDDGSNVTGAIKSLIRAINIERRT